LPNKGHIEEGKADFVLKKIQEDFNLLLSENYEKVAIEIIKSHENRFFTLNKIGRWWDRNEEIDIVALNEEENKILLGEVKWSNKPVGIDIFENLKSKSKKVEWNKEKWNEYVCLFSKSGFTESMLKIAKKEKIILFHKDKLMEI
jgi:AAA+ ATPase superfamily predicted ATPase